MGSKYVIVSITENIFFVRPFAACLRWSVCPPHALCHIIWYTASEGSDCERYRPDDASCLALTYLASLNLKYFIVRKKKMMVFYKQPMGYFFIFNLSFWRSGMSLLNPGILLFLCWHAAPKGSCQFALSRSHKAIHHCLTDVLKKKAIVAQMLSPRSQCEDVESANIIILLARYRI